MDIDFPYLDEYTRFDFPLVERSTPEGIVAVGGNLSPGMLISAYSQGIFPWYSDGEPVLWWSPDPRCVLFPKDLHISHSMKKLMRRKRFMFTLDTCFREIITECKTIPRRSEKGTWITEEMLHAYTQLHLLGYAHSIEIWEGHHLAGGMYGVSLGKCFFGESMFFRVSNASKLALIHLTEFLKKLDFRIIDCQVYSPHLETLGARQIPRDEFLLILKKSLEYETLRGSWTRLEH